VIGTRYEVGGRAELDDARAAAAATQTWIGTVVHRVAYDVDVVAGAIVAAGLPEALADALRRA
jgi:hypothetical protein